MLSRKSTSLLCTHGTLVFQTHIARACLQEALKALADGICVVVFPEGTRSVTGRLQPFKNGFFRLAAENPDIEILPIGEAQHIN